MARFDLTDAEWSIIAPLLPGAEGRKNGRPRPDDRKVLNGIFFVLRSGTSWRDLPERYGPYPRAPSAPSPLQLNRVSLLCGQCYPATGTICLATCHDCQMIRAVLFAIATVANLVPPLDF